MSGLVAVALSAMRLDRPQIPHRSRGLRYQHAHRFRGERLVPPALVASGPIVAQSSQASSPVRALA